MEGTGIVYRLAPAVAAASVAAAVLLVPVASDAPDLGVGRDALVLAGLLALARFAVAASSWEVANGFALMGASRDLTIAVFVEAALVLALAVAALVSGTTDLVAMVAGTAGTRLDRTRRSRSARSRSRSWSWRRRAGSPSTTRTRTSS